MFITNSVINENGQTLAGGGEDRRIYLCEYGIVHVKWGANNLVYCPGDVIGLAYLLSALKAQPCSMECTHGENCPLEHGKGIVYLPYHSVRIPLTIDECKDMHLMAQKAVDRLFELKNGRPSSDKHESVNL
jgi:hypothetical protein